MPHVFREERGTGPFPWHTRGDLYYIVFGRLGGEGIYVYYLLGERPIVVSGSLTGLSEVIRKEVTGENSLRAVVREFMANNIVDLMGEPRSLLLSSGNVSWFAGASPTVIDELKRLNKIPEVNFGENGDWKLGFYVALRNGSLEHWTVRGSIEPFLIRDLAREVIEKPGTLPEILYTEG